MRLLGVVVHLDPVGDPAGQAAHGEQHREHLHGNAEGAVDDAGVEIDVGIELPLDEVRVAEGDLLQFLGDVEQRIVDLQLRQQLVAGLS